MKMLQSRLDLKLCFFGHQQFQGANSAYPTRSNLLNILIPKPIIYNWKQSQAATSTPPHDTRMTCCMSKPRIPFYHIFTTKLCNLLQLSFVGGSVVVTASSSLPLRKVFVSNVLYMKRSSLTLQSFEISEIERRVFEEHFCSTLKVYLPCGMHTCKAKQN